MFYFFKEVLSHYLFRLILMCVCVSSCVVMYVHVWNDNLRWIPNWVWLTALLFINIVKLGYNELSVSKTKIFTLFCFWVRYSHNHYHYRYNWVCLVDFVKLKKVKYSKCIKELDLTLVREANGLFLRHFWPLLERAIFFKAAGVVAKIGSNLKSNHQSQIKLLQIPDTHCIKTILSKYFLNLNNTSFRPVKIVYFQKAANKWNNLKSSFLS